MADFAVLIAPGSDPQAIETKFHQFLHLTTQFKQLEVPATHAVGRDCMAAKLDSSATIHPGMIHDHQTGSWLLAAGTVVALKGDNHPTTLLQNLLQDYVKSGVQALESYDGHFALVIYNGREESLSVVSDPIGLFGIFFSQQGNQVYVSSSAFAVARQIQSQPDVMAAEHFLRTGRLEGDKTLWQDVRRLPGGTVLYATHRHVEKTEYWSPTFDDSIAHLTFNEALEQSVELITHAFSRTLARETKTWVDLTGGFDSRLAAMMVAKINIPFNVYCTGPEDHPDVQLSRKICEEMGWEYVNTQLPKDWEPDQYSWFNTALGRGDGQASVLRLAYTLRSFIERNTTMKTNVMGVGGENWRGFYWQIERLNIGRTSNVNYKALLDSIFPTSFPVQVMRCDRTREVRLQISDFLRQLWSKYDEYPNSVKLDRFGIFRDAGHGGTYLSSISSIGRSLAPLDFKTLVNFAISLSFRWKLPRHHIFIRTMFERENKRLADFDTTTKGPAIPIRITNAHRFWPLWKVLANRAIAIGSKEIFGKTMQIWPERPHLEYPLPTWQDAFRTFAITEGLLNHERMYSGGLYKGNELNYYVEQALPGTHRTEFLDRVISVEMALRAVGSSID